MRKIRVPKSNKQQVERTEFTTYERNIIATGKFVLIACVAVGTMISIWIVLWKVL